MPGFIHTKSDEKKWSKAKSAASKSTSPGSEGYWRLSNHIWHKMDKSDDSVIKHQNLRKLADFMQKRHKK